MRKSILSILKKLKKLNLWKQKEISYESFIEFSNDIGTDASETDTVAAIIFYFYPTDKRPLDVCISEFNRLINKKIKYNLSLNLDFENMPAEYFITADMYAARLDLVSLYNILSGENEKDISLQKANQVKDAFLNAVSHFPTKYEWVYNPPHIGELSKPTIGNQLRQEFQSNYGAYAEITYLISKGDVMKFEKINKMRLENYLSLGEYLLRKKIVENVE